MALHYSHKSMIKESLPEFIAVAEFSINYRKDPKKWGSSGCYGYPSIVLLLAITDAIGSYVIKGNVRNHFNILAHSDYYNLKIDENDITKIYEAYRCLGTHNAVIGKDVILDIGTATDSVFSTKDGIACFNLVPFFFISKIAVAKFLKVSDALVPDEVRKGN
jgi:hypothetical protein